jgi:hypothetical protein
MFRNQIHCSVFESRSGPSNVLTTDQHPALYQKFNKFAVEYGNSFDKKNSKFSF